MKREGVLYVLSKLGVHATLPRSGANVQISCPLAPYSKGHLSGQDRRPSMGISIRDYEDSVVNCFTCKFRGKLNSLVDEMYRYEAIDEETALHLNAVIAELETVPLEKLLEAVGQYDVRQDSYDDDLQPDCYLEPFEGKTHRYILDRGISVDTLKAWECGFDSKEKRVTLPVRNWRGDLVGLVGRGVHKGVAPAYKNYWQFPKGRYLYGENKLIPQTTVIVCEGPLDVLSVWQKLAESRLLNEYSVVGIFGADATSMQVRKLVKMAEDVILFLDNDAAGWEGTKRLTKTLGTQLLTRGVKYPTPVGGDPDELVRSGVDLKELLEQAELLL